MFHSNTSKISNLKIGKNEAPGPGSYEIRINHSIAENSAAFGSNTKRNVPMSGDPHRPFQVGKYQTPPVGNYLSKEEQENIEKLKKKLISADYPIEKAPFNTSEKRIQDFSSETPGPGHYQPVLDNVNKGLLPNKSPRFLSQNSKTPGPGSYQPVIPSTQKSQNFAKRSERFEKDLKNPSLTDSYLKHKPWLIKQTRSPDFILMQRELSFDTTSQRFNRETYTGPGPGQYEVVKSGTCKTARLGGQRSSHGDYRPKTGTAPNLGPGAYDLYENSKKTFNMAKELGKPEVWL